MLLHSAARWRASRCLLLACALLWPRAAVTQHPQFELEPIDAPHWVNSGSLLTINALIGGVSAAVVAEIRGHDGLRAFANGVAGGLVSFMGKEIAARPFDGAGLVGRQVTSLGTSMVQNAAAGLRPLDRVEFPLGPVDVLWDTRTNGWSGRLDPIAVGVFAVAVFHRDFELDGGASLSSGVPVFRAREGMLFSPWNGMESAALEVASVVFLGDLSGFDAATQQRIMAHERMHALQGDMFQAYWGRPLLEWILPESRGWMRVRPFLDVNLGDALTELTDALVLTTYASRPSEIEAEALVTGH